MSEILITEIRASYKRVHDWALELVQDLTNEQMLHQTNTATPSIAFHLWHMGRYADSVEGHIGDLKAQQIWQTDGLAQRWGFDPGVLGTYASGTGMKPEALAALSWPAKSHIVTYARQSFESAERAIGSVEPERLQDAANWGGTIASAILMHLVHESRHLGMIESARGVLGLQGTTTS